MNEQLQDEARFIARLTAGTTHEFRNVLAIVGESAGLIEDLVQASAATGQLNREPVLRAVQRIGRQVTRGADLLSALNGLAHALDQECEALELGEQAQRAALLCHHWLGQGERRLTIGGAGAAVRLRANRLRLCQLLAAALECAAQLAVEGGEVRVAALHAEGRPALRLGIDAAVPPARTLGTQCWDRLLQSAARVGASVELDESGSELVVRFPAMLEDAG